MDSYRRQEETKPYQMVEGASLLDEDLCQRMDVPHQIGEPIGFVQGIVSLLTVYRKHNPLWNCSKSVPSRTVRFLLQFLVFPVIGLAISHIYHEFQKFREGENYRKIKKDMKNFVKDKKKTWRNYMENLGEIRGGSSEYFKITEMLHPAFVCIHLERQRKFLGMKKGSRKIRGVSFFQKLMGTTKLLVTGIALRSVFINSDPKFAYEPKLAPNQLAHDQDLQLRQDRKLMEEVSDQGTIQAGDNLRIITSLDCPKKPSTDKGITEELMSYLESKKKYDSLMDGYMKGDELDSNMKELDSKMEIEKEKNKKSKARRKKSK